MFHSEKWNVFPYFTAAARKSWKPPTIKYHESFTRRQLWPRCSTSSSWSTSSLSSPGWPPCNIDGQPDPELILSPFSTGTPPHPPPPIITISCCNYSSLFNYLQRRPESSPLSPFIPGETRAELVIRHFCGNFRRAHHCRLIHPRRDGFSQPGEPGRTPQVLFFISLSAVHKFD